jgi:hypothetical protein
VNAPQFGFSGGQLVTLMSTAWAEDNAKIESIANEMTESLLKLNMGCPYRFAAG